MMTTSTETTDDRKFTKCRRCTATTTKWGSPKWLERPEIYRIARLYAGVLARAGISDEDAHRCLAFHKQEVLNARAWNVHAVPPLKM